LRCKAYAIYALALTFTFALILALLLKPKPVSTKPFPLPPAVYMTSPGINVDLEGLTDEELGKALELLAQAGFRWVRLRFPWEKVEPAKGKFAWGDWDRIVEALAGRGFHILAVLDTSPDWARRPEDSSCSTAPPVEVSYFGDFAEAFARRYGFAIDAYQIWDEPNIYPHWGERWVDPKGYAALLREGYIRIKSVDPDAIIVAGGFAPTLEKGPLNLNEGDFLRKMLASGARDFFDVVAFKAFGFDYPPSDPPSSGKLNFRRPELWAGLASDKPIWIVEAGWNALPSGWRGGKSIWGSVAEEEQAQWTMEAIRWAEERWGWPIFLTHFRPNYPPDDPHWGFAFVWQDWTTRPVYKAVASLDKEVRILPPGSYRPNHPAIQYQGAWRISPYGADIPHGAQGDVSLKLSFSGTGLDILVRRGEYKAFLFVKVDGKPSNVLPKDSAGRSYVVLYDPLYQTVTVSVARKLPFGTHEVEIASDGGWGHWAIVGFRVRGEERPQVLPIISILALYLIGLSVPFVLGLLDSLSPLARVQIPLPVLLVLAILWFLSPPLVSLLALPLWLLAFHLWPEAGLATFAFVTPFFLLPKNLVVKSFFPQELALALATLGVVIRFRRALSIRLSRLDWAVVALVALGALSLTWAENFGVASYEFRRVLAEPALFYALILLVQREKPRTLTLLADALVASAFLVSLVGISQFFFGNVITAEGVRRVRAFYGSPNNLALFLGRLVPITLAVAIAGSAPRKWLYAVAGAFILGALYLTFSRGALFLGVPAAVLFILFLRGRKAVAIAAIFAIFLALAILPWLWTARFSSLLDLERGTGFFRLKLWQASLSMLKDSPILGVGLDNFLYQYRTRYVLPEAWQEFNLSHPHNILLDWWTRLGIGGPLILGWIVWEFFKAGFKQYRSMGEGEEKAFTLGFMGAMVETIAHGLVDQSFFLPDLAVVFMLTLSWIRHGGEIEKLA
jgi:O-antigen ligase